ncbi:hypothetical protein BH11BAC7_BH11BAC7_14040 [soil metagenome]
MIFSHLKRKAFSVMLFSCLAFNAFSQDNIEGGFYGGYFQLGERSFNDFGLMLHIPVGSATLNYHLGFGTSINSGLYIHSPAGMAAGFWILNKLGGSGLRIGYLSFLLCLVPEGVGIYLPVKGNLSTHISINPLSLEYFYRGKTGEEWGKMGCDVVVRFKVYSTFRENIYFAPQVAGTVIYTPGETTGRYGFKAGFTLGFERRD